jgi:ribosome maturation factor RimP
MATIDRLESLLAPVVEDLGYEYVGIEYASNPKNRVLRLYIDQSETGIGLEDCETVSREVSALLDVEEPIPGQYTLEVSSPGVERPLFTAEHFERFAGEVAVVQMLAPVEGRRKFKGVIVTVEGEEVCLEVDGTQWRLPVAGMAKARLAPDLDALFAEHERQRRDDDK